MRHDTLSVIIPCWNDAAALSVLLPQIGRRAGIAEVIVADASVSEECREVASAAGARYVRCLRPNRGAQMNAGAGLAGGEMLLFQHADTELEQTHVDSLLSAMKEGQLAGGAFHRKFDSRHPALRWLEPWARLWAKVGGSFYGDQSIFVRRSIFNELGGFAEIPLMEDLEFSGRLRRAGSTILLDPPISSSPRRHRRLGAWRTTIRNGCLIALYRLGVSPARLHAWYYGGEGGPAPL